jgi:hypothetical protein
VTRGSGKGSVGVWECSGKKFGVRKEEVIGAETARHFRKSLGRRAAVISEELAVTVPGVANEEKSRVLQKVTKARKFGEEGSHWRRSGASF